MANILFNNKHLTEYAAYGSIAGLFHFLTVWYFLHRSNYHTSPVLFFIGLQIPRLSRFFKNCWGLILGLIRFNGIGYHC